MGQAKAVAKRAELPPGTAKVVRVGRHECALFNVEGKLYALDNACPHRGGPLGEGDLSGHLVYCPLHAWSFDVRTGASPSDPGVCARTYRAWVEGEQVLVDLDVGA